MGWGGLKNGDLLVLAAKEFDVFLTVDKNLPYQQNVANLPVAVIVLEAYSNELAALLPLVRNLEQALGRLQPCTFVRVGE
jgi:UDP-N-acetylmuramoylalanine-D-glutamate ligase